MTLLRVPQLLVFVLSSYLIAASGCGASSTEPEILSKLVPVTGFVSLDGQPLAGVMITYLPEKGVSGAEVAFGMTDENGKYTLHSQIAGRSPENSQGAVPTNYRVYITKLVMPDGSAVEGDITDAEAEEKGARQLLPSKYSSPTATKLTATVDNGPTNNDLDLKK